MAIKNYSEADKIITIFTKDRGKVVTLAKGARKPKSRKRGHLEIFNNLRFSAVLGKGFDLISEASVINSFPQIRKELKKSSVAYFLVEVIGKLTREQEEDSLLYALLLKNLVGLEKSSKTKQLRDNFTREVLIHLGFWPQGKPLDNPDSILEGIAERKFSSIRVGKKMLG